MRGNVGVMDSLFSIRPLLAYSDQMNRLLLDAAAPLSAEQLDRHFDLGMQSLRKTLAHILVAETVWLERWRGNGEVKWPPYETTQSPAAMLADFETLWPQRDVFLASLTPEKLGADQVYRDSKGSQFTATLHEMILQGIVHSTHHRAQAVHMLRRVGGPFVEMDFMYARRRSV